MKTGDRVIVPWTIYKMGTVIHTNESLDHSSDFQILVKDEETGVTKMIDKLELALAQKRAGCSPCQERERELVLAQNVKTVKGQL